MLDSLFSHTVHCKDFEWQNFPLLVNISGSGELLFPLLCLPPLIPFANLGLFISCLLLGLLDFVINAALFLEDKFEDEAVLLFLEGVGLSAMEAAEVAEETADFFSEAKRLRRCILE